MTPAMYPATVPSSTRLSFVGNAIGLPDGREQPPASPERRSESGNERSRAQNPVLSAAMSCAQNPVLSTRSSIATKKSADSRVRHIGGFIFSTF